MELLGLQQALVEDAEFDEDAGVLGVSVRVPKRAANRYGRCRRPCRRFDDGRGVRRWRALDVGGVRAYVQAAAPRVRCRRHGVVGQQQGGDVLHNGPGGGQHSGVGDSIRRGGTPVVGVAVGGPPSTGVPPPPANSDPRPTTGSRICVPLTTGQCAGVGLGHGPGAS